MNSLLILIISIPIIEIYLFIKIGSQICALTTIFLIFLTAFIGLLYARYEGFNTLRSGMSQLIKNELPMYEIISGAALAFAALLLIIPGFATDFLGLLIIFPPTRKFLLKNVFPIINVNAKNGSIFGDGTGFSDGKDIFKIQSNFENITIEDFEINSDQNYKDLTKLYGKTFFIKDTCSGSSNNIFQIKSNEDFNNFLLNKNNREFMIEKKISSDEYTAAILNDKVLPIINIIPPNEFYDFDAKYKSEKTKFLFP